MSKDTQGVQECWASRDTKEQERSRGGYELRAGGGRAALGSPAAGTHHCAPSPEHSLVGLDVLKISRCPSSDRDKWSSAASPAELLWNEGAGKAPCIYFSKPVSCGGDHTDHTWRSLGKADFSTGLWKPHSNSRILTPNYSWKSHQAASWFWESFKQLTAGFRKGWADRAALFLLLYHRRGRKSSLL